MITYAWTRTRSRGRRGGLCVDEALHASYRLVGPGYKCQGVFVCDLALLVERYHLGAEALEVGEGVGKLALAQLGARAVELADKAGLVLGGVLADEGGVLGLHPQRGDVGLALVDGLGMGGLCSNPQQRRQNEPEQDARPHTCSNC